MDDLQQADTAQSVPPQTLAPKHSKYRKPILIILILIVILVAIVVFLYWWFVWQFEENTDDAYVTGNIVNLMPQISGIVTAIKADDTDLVEQNQPIVLLDDTDTKIALANAEANLATTIRQVRELYENVGQQKANVAVQAAQYTNAQQDLKRREGSFKGGAVSAENLQHAQTNLQVTQSSLTLAHYQYSAANVLVENTQLLNYPTVKQAEANLRQAYLNNQRTTLNSPVTGFVAKRSVQLGQQIAPGQALLSIVPLNQIWIEANFKEVQLADIRIGQPVTFTTDIYGNNVVYHGKVMGIGAGTGSVFSLLPAQNATGNWIKIVQRLPVRISIEPKELIAHPLRIGLSARVIIDTHDTSGKMLATSPVNNIHYQTGIYQTELQGAQQLIDRIVQENAGTTAANTATHLPWPDYMPKHKAPDYKPKHCHAR